MSRLLVLTLWAHCFTWESNVNSAFTGWTKSCSKGRRLSECIICKWQHNLILLWGWKTPFLEYKTFHILPSVIKEREGSYKLTFFKKGRVVNKREEIKWVLSLSLSLKMVPKRVSFGKGWFYRNGFMARRCVDIL